MKININKICKIFGSLILILILYLLFSGFNSWSGFVSIIINFSEKLYHNTYFGKLFFSEFILVVILILMLFLFKKGSIFFKKEKSFLSSLFLSWPFMIYSVITFVFTILQLNISDIDIYEFIALILFSFCIGFFEEVVFRGWFQNKILGYFDNDEKGVILSIAICSLFFSLMHIVGYFNGQNFLYTFNQLIFTFFVGILFGIIYFCTKNIWSVIFLHGFWNLSVFFSQINISKTCVVSGDFSSSSLSISIFFISLLFTLFSLFPEIFTSLILIKENFSNNLKKKSNYKKHNLIFVISMIIYFIIYSVAFYFLNFNGNVSACPDFINKEVKNFSEQEFNYTEYNLDINKPTNKDKVVMDGSVTVVGMEYYEYDFKITKNNILLLNVNGKQYKFDYYNVLNIGVYMIGDNYNIILLANDNSGNNIVYYSDFLGKYNVDDDDEFIEEFMESFKQIIVPITVEKIGTYHEDDKTYPLFISSTGERYIYIDGEIHTYKK